MNSSKAGRTRAATSPPATGWFQHGFLEQTHVGGRGARDPHLYRLTTPAPTNRVEGTTNQQPQHQRPQAAGEGVPVILGAGGAPWVGVCGQERAPVIECALTGRLGRDGELRHVRRGNLPLVAFSVCVEGKDEDPDAPRWVRVIVLGDSAVALAPALVISG